MPKNIKKTSNLETKVPTPPQLRNPTGKGGFGDRPQDINLKGSWSPENSQTYLLRRFSKMSEADLLAWGKKTKPQDRTAAEMWAYTRALRAKTSLIEYKEVVDRTEGRAVSKTEITGAEGKPIEIETKLSPEQQDIINKGIKDIFIKLYSDDTTEVS